MRLLQAMAGATVGGAENFFSRLAPALARAGVEQLVLMRPEPARERLLRDAGIPVAMARFGGALDFTTGSRFRAEIEAFRPHVVLSWMNRATAYCPPGAKLPGFVHLGTPRGYYAARYYRRCDHLVCTTDLLVAHFAAAGWPADRLTRIPNFCPDQTAPAQSRAELDTPDGATLVLALGRFHVNKGFDVLLSALARLPDHFLWLGGSGKLETRLKRLAGELGVAGRVRFLGWRAETAPLFAAADVFACPSRVEPFGNIVIEAWAQRVPVVAANATGPGALVEDGTSGLLVPVDDAAALAAALDRLRHESGLAEGLAAAGRGAYERGFTEGVVVRGYLDLLQRLAG
jgi:glycosyltransferase involved in cell wall biosynthesis